MNWTLSFSSIFLEPTNTFFTRVLFYSRNADFGTKTVTVKHALKNDCTMEMFECLSKKSRFNIKVLNSPFRGEAEKIEDENKETAPREARSVDFHNNSEYCGQSMLLDTFCQRKESITCRASS